jgi:hypothetical protein
LRREYTTHAYISVCGQRLANTINSVLMLDKIDIIRAINDQGRMESKILTNDQTSKIEQEVNKRQIANFIMG